MTIRRAWNTTPIPIPVFTPAYDATTVSLRALDKVTELNKPEIEEKVDETNELQTRNTNNKKQLNTMEFRLLKAINAVANNKTLDETASAVIGAGAEEMYLYKQVLSSLQVLLVMFKYQLWVLVM